MPMIIWVVTKNNEKSNGENKKSNGENKLSEA
jgi:hypothetical protein